MPSPHNNQQLADLIIPGLNFAPDNYAAQLREKAAAIARLFKPFAMPQIATFDSPALHFRMRAEFRIWHDNAGGQPRCYYAMFERNAPKSPVEIRRFPIACRAINSVMAPLLDEINACEKLSHKLFQAEFLASTSGQLVVSLIYHRQLDEAWQARARALEKKLDVAIIGRARKQRIVLSRDFVLEDIEVDGRCFRYEQKENSFSQPNAAINRQMIEWATGYLATQNKSPVARGDFIEMYCGNGNFTLPLAQYFNRVIGTEVSKTSIASAQRNCILNGVNNITFARLSGEETACALRRERDFRRLRHIDLDAYKLNTVLVDPPRAGLDPETLQFVAGFSTIIYISCNPQTLASNLTSLNATHDVAQAAIFDQFPYSSHCECGVILERKP